MVQSADDVHFRAAGVDGFLPAGQNLLVAHAVALGFPQIGPERTENTAVDANVRRIQVNVDVVVSEIAVFFRSRTTFASSPTSFKCTSGRVQQQPIIHVEPLAGFDLGTNFFDRRFVGCKPFFKRLIFFQSPGVATPGA